MKSTLPQGGRENVLHPKFLITPAQRPSEKRQNAQKASLFSLCKKSKQKIHLTNWSAAD